MNRLALSFSALLLASACSSAGKDPVTDLPFPGDYEVGKEDSWRTPLDGGRLVLGEFATGAFDQESGWVGHEIDITAGPIDLRLTASDLDTILVVYGPQDPGGRYPLFPVAINDDAAPGQDLSSLITMEGFEPGTYRVIASTYDNLLAWPYNVSRGLFVLSAWCGVAGVEACGPEIHGIGGTCFDDWRCISGAHCEGEITCAPGTQCLWVREGSCVENYEWLTLGTVQCGGNPWEGGEASDDEIAQIDSYFEARGFDLMSIGLVDLAGDVVCQSCSCSRGDALVVKAREADADALVEGFGFARLDPDAWRTMEPVQCGGNPWEESESVADEIASVRAWAESSGAPLAEAGFVHDSEPSAVCSGCACPRGDLLVVRAADASAAASLGSLGFGPLIAP
jgi:hypothetical protein